MLSKQYVKSRGVYKVTFLLPSNELPEGLEVHSVRLVGEFNAWDETDTPMSYNRKKKAYTAQVELEPGGEYQYRYLINGEFWYNDWAADAYIPGNFGEDNCVVTTPEVS